MLYPPPEMMRSFRRVLAVLAMTAVVVAACTSSSAPPARHTHSTLIAWIRNPAPPTTSTTTTTTTLAPAPFCARSDLRVQFLGFGAAASMFSDVFELTNIGKTTCRLQGQPKLSPSTTAGAHVPSVVRHGYLPLDIVPGNLAPKASGYVIIGGTDNCPSSPGAYVEPVSYKYVVVLLPNAEGSFTTSEMPPCVPMRVSLGVVPPNPYTPVPGTLPSLQATMQLPKRIVGGRVLYYVVVLANPGAIAVPLKPCPGYQEGFYPWGASPPPLVRAYRLNCGQLRVLAPHHALRLAMELPVPKVSQVMNIRFGWVLITGNGPWAGTEANVYPPGVFPPAPGDMAFLQAKLALPFHAIGGQVLHYSVVLSNPGPRAVSFSRCPGYTESLVLNNGSKIQTHTWSYELNCQTVRRLEAGKTVRFAMKMTVPKVSRTEGAKVIWELDTGNGPFAGSGVTVNQ